MMKKLSTLLIAVVFFAANSMAQNLPEQDCSGAIPVCQPVYTQANSYVGYGPTDELNSANEDCLLSGENNTVWYIINISSSGTLVFDITPNNPNDDYDFAVWDATGIGCAALNNPPTRCNYASNGASLPGGLTGLSTTAALPSYGAGGPSYSSAINAIAGQTYILVVDNFSNTQFGYTLDFSASTASIFDTLSPTFTYAGSHCGTISNQINVSMSEPVKCNSIDANGSNFYITPNVPGVSNVVAASSATCSGTSLFTNNYVVQFAGTLPPGTYWLHAQQGNDANSLLDNCGNEQSYDDSIQFIMVAGNPPQMVRLDTPACIRARVILDRAISCATVAANGSDFTISGPSTVNVVNAVPIGCNAVNMTDTIDLTFDRSIVVAGTYTLGVQVGTDGNSIVDTCNVSIAGTLSWEVSDKGVVASVNPDLLCDPGYVQLTANTTLQPLTPTSFAWQPAAFISDTTASSTLAFVNQSADYYVRMLDQDYCYRRDTTSVILSVRNPGMIQPFDTAICIGDAAQLTATGGLQYAWFPVQDLSCTTCPDPIATPQQTTTYYVSISDQYNCADTLGQTIIVFPLPQVDAGDDVTIYYGQQTELHAGAEGIIYLWTPTTGLNYFTEPNPIASPQTTTTYTIKVIDANQCKNSDSVTVFVRDDIPVIIPSAFSPNGDGRNDVFRIANSSFHRLQEFRIFNRWGQEVFSTTDIKKGWDGTFNNIPQEAGVYNYLIRVAYPDGKVELFKGDVTLVR